MTKDQSYLKTFFLLSIICLPTAASAYCSIANDTNIKAILKLILITSQLQEQNANQSDKHEK